MPLTNWALDKYVAPDLSKLTECNAIDMTGFDDQCEDWVANFVLNSMLRVDVQAPYRAYTFVLLRRAEMAFVEHENARIALQQYVSGGRGAITLYLRAVFHFESFVAQSYQALEVIRKWTGEDLFENRDGSVLDRLNLIYGRSKHADKAIAAGQLPPDATMPVWLTNDGLQADSALLTYDDMADVLKELSSIAGQLSCPKPLGQVSS